MFDERRMTIMNEVHDRIERYGFGMKRKNITITAVLMAASMLMTACGASESVAETTQQTQNQVQTEEEVAEGTAVTTSDEKKYEDAVKIVLSDEGITVDGEAAASMDTEAVYVSNDIIYYEDKDTYESGNAYGEGTDADKHTAEEAAAHTVVNITQPGAYHVSGVLSAGQIFVNVGEEETDKVTLILDDVDITCSVAPAVMFYEVYECDADASEDTATKDVDTSDAGAKVILADGSENNISGSYVARIYKDNDEEKKLHKYDGAFYSKMSMEISGEEKGDGILNITAENEGLGSEIHLTVNGGTINIKSVDDGINTSEDGISVCTINGGNLNIQASEGQEGDGIDSNGWLVINGGTVFASSNPTSPDAGIDSDMGIYINGGTVIACGNMYDEVAEESKANTMVLQFAGSSKGDLSVKNADGEEMVAFTCPSDYTNLVISSEELVAGSYQLFNGDTQLSYSGSMMGMGGGRLQMPGNGDMPVMAQDERPELPNGEKPQLPDGEEPKFAEGERPQMPYGEIPAFAEGERPEMPQMPQDGQMMPPNKERPDMDEAEVSGEKSTEFTIEKGVHFFGGVI